jgi:hypothetical protein
MLRGRLKMPRARFWLPLAAVALFALCVRFDLHYHVIGFFRGDEYYQGLPTSYWRDAATYRIHGPPAWLRPVHRWLPRPGIVEMLPLYKGGVEALGVLRQLAEDQSTDVEVRLSVLRLFQHDGAFRLWEKPPPVPEIFDVARRCFDDPHADVRHESALLLLNGDDPEPAFEMLFEHHLNQLRNPAPTERIAGISGLGRLTHHCERARKSDLLKHIRAMEKDANRGVRDHARMIGDHCAATIGARE